MVIGGDAMLVWAAMLSQLRRCRGQVLLVVLLVMYTENALVGAPPITFPCQELSYTVIPNVNQVVNFTHAVFIAITGIHLSKLFTWKILATEAELAFALVAESQSTLHQSFHLILPDVLAARTRIPGTQMRSAYPAVHATRSN